MRHQDKDPWSFPHHCFDTPSRTRTHWIDFLKWVVGAIILVLVLVQVAYAEVVDCDHLNQNKGIQRVCNSMQESMRHFSAAQHTLQQFAMMVADQTEDKGKQK